MTSTLNVLLVEDDVVTSRLLERLLESRGYQVSSFGDAESALARLAASQVPQILLLDWVLPGMDGLDLCRQIRALPGGDRALIVVLTARDQSEDLQQVLDAGADDYLTKPIDIQGLHVRLTIAERHVQARRQGKLAEEKVVEIMMRLQKSHDDLLSILNQLRVGSAITDADGRILFVSRVCQRLIRVDPASILGQPWEVLFASADQDHEAIRKQVELPPAQRAKIGTHLQGSGGQRYWVEVEVQDDPRDPQRKIFVFYDLSEVQDLRRLLSERAHFQDLIGKSEPMLRIFEQIRDLARVDSTVLIEGETGTGKELVARAIHSLSERRDGPFIAMNCAGLTDSLLGSQLFGHKRGAFTGAVEDHKGLFEASDGGTLFLDELGDIPANVQTSLLRVLQEREIVRLGETKPRPINVRVLAATHHSLADDVAKGIFRADLLYRIRVARIELPPLQARREDIPLLAVTFLRLHSATSGKQVHDISSEAMRLLVGYEWPGNVRELRSAIEFAVIRCRGAVIEPADLPPELIATAALAPLQINPELDMTQRILAAIAEAKGNRAVAARLLGISRATLYRRLEELQIPQK